MDIEAQFPNLTHPLMSTDMAELSVINQEREGSGGMWVDKVVVDSSAHYASVKKANFMWWVFREMTKNNIMNIIIINQFAMYFFLST